jgi:hypothetical protein
LPEGLGPAYRLAEVQPILKTINKNDMAAQQQKKTIVVIGYE